MAPLLGLKTGVELLELGTGLTTTVEVVVVGAALQVSLEDAVGLPLLVVEA